jgi:hypothetical protein
MLDVDFKTAASLVIIKIADLQLAKCHHSNIKIQSQTELPSPERQQTSAASL